MTKYNDFKFVSPDLYPSWVSEPALLVLDSMICNWVKAGQGDGWETAGGPEMRSRIENKFGHYQVCFRSKSMEQCWKKLEKLRFATEHEPQILFSLALWASLPHIKGRPVTKGVSDKWKSDLLNTLTKARDLAYGTPENMMSWIGSSNGYLKKALVDCDFEGRKITLTPYPHDVLEALILALDQTDYSSLLYGSHVKGEFAERCYFIRALTVFFYQEVGKPCRKIVADAASVAFDRPTSERQVIRATQGIDWRNQQDVVPSYLKELNVTKESIIESRDYFS
jgi:hypothetical protein